MSNITVTPSAITFSAQIDAATLASLLGAVEAAAPVTGLPTGKTLADVKNLNINKLPNGGAQIIGTVSAV